MGGVSLSRTRCYSQTRVSYPRGAGWSTVRPLLTSVTTGFKHLNQAQLLHDVIWYPDTLEPRQWLIYYISRPLVGSWDEIKIQPAIFVPGMGKKKMLALARATSSRSNDSVVP